MLRFIKIYYGVGAGLFNELVLLIGLLIAPVTYPHGFSYFGMFLILVALIAMFLRGKRAVAKINLIENGSAGIAKLLKIQDTNLKIKGQRVRKYIFRFNVEGEEVDYIYKSHHRKEIAVGDSREIYYSFENPKKAIIPSLYGVKQNRNHF